MPRRVKILWPVEQAPEMPKDPLRGNVPAVKIMADLGVIKIIPVTPFADRGDQGAKVTNRPVAPTA